MTPDLRVLPTPAALFDEAAALFVSTARDAVARRGVFAVALAGGSTPKQLYAALAKHRAPDVPWADTHFFWGDERHVPPDHPDSNYRMAHEALLQPLGVDARQIHRIRTEWSDAGVAAAAYEVEIRAFFRLGRADWPRFDLVLLGLGADGHTASLFPGTQAPDEASRFVVTTQVPRLGTRITLTAPVLNHAARVVFLVEGAAKAAAVASVLDGPADPERTPAQRIKPVAGEIVWLLDRAAAASLSH